MKPDTDLIKALSEPQNPQAREGKKGDPQLSALCQFIVQNYSDTSEGVIVDYGSGNGLLANYLNQIYEHKDFIPEYWAVDLPQYLDVLSLPNRVHNNSKKFTAENFLTDVLPAQSDKIHILVLRNILHELDINTTATLFEALLTSLSSKTIIYIQDMQDLPVPERGNIGWNKNLLEKCLIECGFKIKSFDLESYSGVPWFSMIAFTDNNKKNYIKDIIAKYRTAQLEEIESKLIKISEDWEKTSELMLLQHEYSSLVLQLRKANWLTTEKSEIRPLTHIGIQTNNSELTHLEYLFETNIEMGNKTGLIAMLSSKNLLSFPEIILSAKKHVYFGGYSNRPLFLKSANTKAIKKSIDSGVEIKILVVDPDCEAAILRSTEPVYENPHKFIANIKTTISLGTEFFQNLSNEIGLEKAAAYFKMSLTRRTPRWSYFIVDDTCYLSLYSLRLSGSNAPCFVFRGSSGAVNNYYFAAKQEFEELFKEGTILFT